MKRFIFILLTLIIFLSCATKPEVIPKVAAKTVFFLPEPEKVLFYRDGTTVYETKIPVDAIVNKSFVLPQEVNRNSLTIVQEGERIFSYSLAQGQVLVQLSEEDPRNPSSKAPLIAPTQVLLVTISELKPDSPLDVKFGIGRSGISWELVLDMETAEGNTLNCNLLASITLEATTRLTGTIVPILAKKPEIILLSSSNAFIEGSDAAFNIGNILIEPAKTTFIKLDEGKSSYRQVYVWNADEKEHPEAYLYCSNPFASSLSKVRVNLNSNGLNINSYSAQRLIPGRQFNLLVGEQPLINTFKSALTQEFPEKEFPNRVNLPFTHTLEYRATNNLGIEAELEISIPVTYGRVHRTQYNFKKQPDERPGDRMIWKYKLAPNANANLEFSFDAERKDNSRYSDYDYYQGGR